MADKFVSIVEEDHSLREALVGLIRSHGYPARGYASAVEYLAVQDGQCACVISDIRMPGLSGIEMAARLREQGHSVPMIMITARSAPELERQAHANGAVCLLEKPFTAQALMDCVAQALDA